ncbi:AAA family ATPase [Nocardia sp. NBC_01503]|uniref:AAA family ATPase n=1 Tax=Nocardia sp. NBC_01503 TaxID=2975997 RepID=UPI002E7C32D0|nr:AAA family ATPase [Nocardia sp. NBC_01503]WTL29917.1 AAA family ATPase [Nocardia sp. NBC_01503]
MNRAPSSSGETTGSVRARGGYDAYFGSAEQSDTGSTWRSTVAGRSHHQPPPPPGRAQTPEADADESPETGTGFAAGPEPGGADPGPESPAFAGAPNTTYAPTAPPPGFDVQSTPTPPAAPVAPPTGSYPPTGSAAPTGQAPQTGSAAPIGQAAQSGSVAPTGHAAPYGSAAPTGQAVPIGSTVSTGQAAAFGAAEATAPATAHTAPTQARGRTGVQPDFFSPPAVQDSRQQAAAPAVRTQDRGARSESAGYQALPISLTSNELLADIAASRQAQLRSTSGMRGALNKVGFSLGLSPAELRTEDRHARIRRQLGTAYQIAVLNVKGGVGRTTTVAALGATFASLRPDRVTAIDANPDFGDLAARTSRHPFGLTLRDLAQERQLDAFSAVQSFASITNSDLAVVSSPWTPAAMEALTGSEYLAATETLRKHYNLLLVDCGTGVLGSAARAVLESSDSVVLVTPATVRGVTGAVATLEWLNAHGQYRLAANSVIAIVLQQPTKPVVEVERIEELFATAQRPTFVIPYDEHLAEGGEIDLRLLDKDTALAFEELAATVADGFPDTMMAGYGRPERGGRQ